MSLSQELKGEKNKMFSTMRLNFPSHFEVDGAQTNAPITIAGPLPKTNTLQGFFLPPLVPWNPTLSTMLQLSLDDLDLAERKDSLTLIWGAVIGAGAALLADAISKIGAQLLRRSA
jgi:hypothetical protein